jgi:hypothetical protein
MYHQVGRGTANSPEEFLGRGSLVISIPQWVHLLVVVNYGTHSASELCPRVTTSPFPSGFTTILDLRISQSSTKVSVCIFI